MAFWVLLVFTILVGGAISSDSTNDWSNIKPAQLTVDSKSIFKAKRVPKPRIFGGEEVNTIQHMPYQCRLYLTYEDSAAVCGCSVLSDEYIVTAAHCLTNVISLTAYFGTNNPGTKQTGDQRQVIEKSAFIVHEKYSLQDLINDIALVKLPKKLEITQYVKPIKFYCGDIEKTKFDDQWVSVSGWGAVGNGKYSEILNYAYVRVTDEATCKEVFPSYITSSHICSSGETAVGVCSGDSGGPMSVNVDGEAKLLGVASFIAGQGCERALPRVFTRVSSFASWIKEKSNISC